MQPIDLVVGGITLFIALKGLYHGLIEETGSLMGLLAGLWIGTSSAHNTLLEWLQRNLPINSPSALSLLSFIFLLFGTWLLAIALAHLLAHRLSIAKPIHLVGGALVASIKVFLILSLITHALWGIEAIRTNGQPYVQKSLLFPYLLTTGKRLALWEKKL